MAIIVLFLAMLIPDAYVWHHFMRHSAWTWQLLYWLPYIVTVVTMILLRTPLYEPWLFRLSLTLILCFTVPKLFFMLFSLIGLAAGHFAPAAVRVMDIAGGVAAMGMLGVIVYGLFIGWRQLEVNEVELAFDNLPEEFDGYRIAHLSDLHVGTYHAAPEMVDSIVDTVNRLDVDLVCFTGDLVNISPDELDPFMSVFPRMKARDGVFSIMGNHDYCMYRRVKDANDERRTIRDLQQREEQFGWTMLLNDNRTLTRGNDSILLAGVENSSRPPFPDYGNLPKALKTGGKDAPFTILLSHDPTHWQREVLPKSKVQLQLSGHTHSTQFRVFGWSPASFTYKEYAGLYEMLANGTETFNPKQPVSSSRKLYVSVGTGGNLPFRVGVSPEIVVITLKKK